MIVDITKEYPTAEEMVIPWLKFKLGLKCGENIRKLSDAPSLCHTASFRVGSGWGSAVNLRNSTMTSNMILHTPPNTQQV